MLSQYKNVSLVSEDEYNSIVQDKGYVYLKEYLKKAMIVHKSNSLPIYYLYYKRQCYKIEGHTIFVDFVAKPEKFVNPPSEIGEPREIMFNKNKYGGSFPKYTTGLIEELLRKIDLFIPSTEFNYTFLDKIDLILMQRADKAELIDSSFVNFLALIGDLLIKETPRLRWRMDLSKVDHVTWNPNLDYKGQVVVLAAHLYENLELRKGQLKKPLTYTYNTIKAIIEMNLSQKDVSD